MTQSISPKPGLIHGLGLVGLVVPLTLPLSAQSTYVGGTGNWSTAASWNPAAVPASGAAIVLSGTSLTSGVLTLDGNVSRVIGSYTHGDAGLRTNEFVLQTTAGANLTMNGGIMANGNFTGVGLRLRGHYIIGANQNWQVGGEAGSHALDRGVTFNEISAGNAGSLLLNGNLTKIGTGQLSLAAGAVSGPSDIIVNDGTLKLNAGGSLPLTISGAGKISVNNATSLLISKNSGTFAVTRPIQFNHTSKLETGSGRTDQTGTYEIASDMEWTGSHTITNQQNTTPANVNYLFSGVMSGNGNVLKNGASTLTLGGTAANTYTGTLTVGAGELRLEKPAGTAVTLGNIVVTGGGLRIFNSNQIPDTATLTVSGGNIIYTAARLETIAALTISSAATSSVSGFTVTGATSITAGTQELNSGEKLTTNSLSIANATLRPVGNAAVGLFSTVDVGAGGLNLNSGRIVLGNPGAANTIDLKLAGNVLSNGTSLVSATNNSGPRVINLLGGTREFAINSGTFEIRPATENGTNNGPSVDNGTFEKSGTGTLILSRSPSTANFSLTAGPVQIKSENGAGNVALAGSTLQMDIGGNFPAKLTTTGNFTTTAGSIDIIAPSLVTFTGTRELVRYTGNLVGTPVVNIPDALKDSRVNLTWDAGTGTNSAITITSTAVPVALTWNGNSGGTWDNKTTANFTGTGAEMFYALDSVTFGDTAGANPAIQLNSAVFPTDVVFDHGTNVATYTLSGTGSISGPTKLTKKGTGTTILATDNNYTGITDIVAGTLQVGNGGLTGSLGTGTAQVPAGTTLRFARDGYAVVGTTITGAGALENSGPGTVALTANNTGFTGTVTITGGTLQIGNGGDTGSLGTLPINVAAGATFGVKRSGAPTIGNSLSGEGSLSIVGGGPIIAAATVNSHTGGVSVSDGGHLRVGADTGLGENPLELVPNAIRLNYGGLKNQDSNTVVGFNRGIAITGEAYFAAGWTKVLTIDGPITGSGNIFINYDSGRVYFSNSDSDWTGMLTLGANKPGSENNTGGILEVTAVNNAGVAGPLGKATAAPGNLVFNGGRLLYSGVDAGSTDRGFTLQGSGTIEVPNSTLTLSGQATGTGTLTKAGAGTLVLSGNSDFTGGKTLSGGTLVLKSPTALGATPSNLTFTGTTSTLELATNSSVAPYSITVGAGNAGKILAGVGTPGFGGINHVMGELALSTVTLTVDKSADVTGGDPRVSFSNLNLPAGSAGTSTLNPTGAAISIGSATITGSNFAKTLTLGGTNLGSEVTGTISDGINVLSLRKENNSLWTLSGASTFTGNVTVDDGMLVLSHTNALGDPAKTLVIAGDDNTNRTPEVRLFGGISPTVANVNLSGSGMDHTAGAIRNLAGDNTLNVTTQMTIRTGNGATVLHSDSGTLTINTPLLTANATARTLTLTGPGNGVINGVIANGSTTTGLPITKDGTGTWTLTGAHTYTGATIVNAGVLSLSQAALANSSTVVIAPNGKLNLNFSGIDRVGTLTINGVTKPDGVYDATTDPSFITGSGAIRVGPEPAGYSTWASGYPFTPGVNDGVNDDPDGDGIANVLEYVLGGVPVGAGASNTSILPTQSVNATDLVFTFRRSDASESDVTLKVQYSNSLGGWTDFATIGAGDDLPKVDVTEDSPSATLDTVVVTVPRNIVTGGKLFVRLQAVK